MPSNRLEVLITGSAANFNRTLDEVKSNTEKSFGAIRDQAQQVSLAFGAVSAAGGLLIKEFVGKAAEMEGFSVTLNRVMGSAQAGQAELKRLADFAASTPFDMPGVVQAGITLRALGVDAEKFLPLAGDLASVFNKDITEGALALGKALAGTQDGVQMLADTYGISRQQMADFGAHMKSDGSIAIETAGDIDKLRAAIEKIVTSRYGGTMEQQAQTLNGVLSTLSDSIGQFAATLGAEFAPTIKDAAKFLTGLVDGLKGLDPATKSNIAGMVGLATITAGAVTAIAGMIAVLGPVAAGWVFYTKAVAAATIASEAATAAELSKAGATLGSARAAMQVALAMEAEALAAVQAATTSQGLAIAQADLAAAQELVAVSAAEVVAAEEAVLVAASGAAAGQGQLAVAGNAAAASQTRLAGALTATRAAIVAHPLGALAVVLGTVAGLLAVYTSALSKATVEADRQVVAEAHAIQQLHQKRQVLLLAADAIQKYGGATVQAVDEVVEAGKRLGQTDLDFTKTIVGQDAMLRNLREQARKLSMHSGFQDEKRQIAELIAKYEQRMSLLIAARKEMRGTYAEQQAQAEKAAAAEKAGQEAKEKALQDYKKKATAGFYETAREQLAALDQVLTGMSKTHKEHEELTLDRVKLARKAKEEETKAAEDGRKKELDVALHAIRMVTGEDEAAAKKRLKLMDQLLKRTDLDASERMRLEEDRQREQDQLEQKRDEAKKRRSEEAKKRAKEEADAQIKVLESQSKGADESLAALRDQVKEGKATTAQLEEQLALRDALLAKIRLEKAEMEGQGKSTKAQADLRRAAQEENDAARRRSAREVEQAEEEGAKRRAREVETEGRLKLEQAKAEEDRLKDQLQAGGKVGQQVLDQVKRRQQLESEALRARAEGQRVGASESEQALIDKQLQIELLQLKRDQKAEVRAITEEIKRQQEAQKKKDDGFTLGGMSTDVNDTSAFDIKKKDDDKQKLLDLQADEAAARAETDQELAKSKQLDKGKVKDGEAAGQAASTAEALVAGIAQVVSLLQAIKDTPNEVTVKSSQLPTERYDWRTSTNKMSGVG